MKNLEFRLRTRYREKTGLKQDALQARPAVIGDMTWTVDVPGRQGFIWVQTSGGVLPVYNSTVTAVAGMSVMIGYDPRQPGVLQVISTGGDSATGSSGGSPSPGASYAPATRYEWWSEGAGEDPVFIDIRAFLPGRVAPAGGMYVSIYPLHVFTGTGDAYVAAQNVNLTSYIPETNGKSRWALIWIDTSGAMQITASSEVTTIAYSQIPAAPAAALRLAAVRLFYGQTAVIESRASARNDICDLRLSGGGYPAAGNRAAVTTKTDDYTATELDEVIVCNKATAMTITLPAAVGGGQEYTIKSIGAGAVTVDGNASETIDGQTTQVVRRWEAVVVVDYESGSWVIV